MGELTQKIPKLRFKGFLDGWEEKKLGYFGSVKMCKRIFKEETTEVGDIPFYKIGTFGNVADSYISQTIYNDYVMRYPYPEQGAILISASGTIGRTVVYNGEKAYYQDSNIVWLKHDKTQLSNVFLHQVLQKANWNELEGSTIKRLYNNDLLNRKEAFPSLKEQTRIGNFFQKLDQTIERQQQALDSVQEYKKAMLQKLFPQKGEKVPKIRFAGFSGDWDIAKLEKLSDVYDGTHQTPNYIKQGVKFLSVENILTLESDKYISLNDFYKDFKVYPQKNDLLMTRIGSVGVVNIVKTDELLAYYVSLALIKPKGLINSLFLLSCICSPNVQKSIWKRTLHIAFPKKINKGEIGKIEIHFPVLEEQQKIGEFFQKLDQQIEQNTDKLKNYQTLKKAMLQRLFV